MHSNLSPGGVLSVGVACLFLFLAAAQRFNTPPTNRSGTTFARFYVGMLIYFSMLVAVWLCTLAFLGAGAAVSFKLKEVSVDLKLNEVSQDILPAVAALLVIILLYSNYEPIRKLEEGTRQICEHLASIPLLAEQLAYELAYQAKFHILSERLKTTITAVISDNIGANAVNFRDDESLSSRFTRAISLYWLFIEPYNNGTALEFPASPSTKFGYVKTMQLGEKTVLQANSHYEMLMELGAAHFNSAKPIRQVEDPLKKVTREISNLACSLIARFVLLQEKTLTQRHNRLLSMGFDRYDPLPVFGATAWAIVLLGVGAVTLLMVYLTPVALPTSEKVLRAIVFLMQIGISIAAGTFLAQRFATRQDPARRQRFIFELMVACLVVITISSGLRIGGSLVSAALVKGDTEDFLAIISDFIDRWSGVMYPVANTISISLACGYLIMLKWSRLRVAIVGAIFNGLVFVATAFVVSLLLPDHVLTELNPDVWAARLTITQNSGVLGAVIGGLVLAMFKKARQETSAKVADAENVEASYGRHATPAQSQCADKPLGGYPRANVEDLEGTYVCFRPMFANPDIVNAYLVKIHWDPKQSCLAFEETKRADTAYVQQGKIYIPDGKPFMNLVTTEKGDVRLITVSRPDAQGVARGLIMTLSVPGGVSFVPASVPIVLRRLGNQDTPKLGFVKPDDSDYTLYRSELLGVLPDFGVLAQPSAACSRATVVQARDDESQKLRN
jgi:hypothetical protein